MKDEFEKFVNNLRECRSGNKACPWEKEQTFESRTKELLLEAEEVKEAVEKKDYENLKEEVGDVIWDSIALIVIAEEKGLFTAQDVFKNLNSKITRRKPWVFGDVKVNTKEEAVAEWNKIKKIEKNES